MAHTIDVHVGDIGTLYKGRLTNSGVNIDPSGATVTQLIFYTPSGTVTKNATVTTTGSGTKQKWYLTYTVLAADTALGLHLLPGVYRWQGYVKFASGSEFYTDIQEYVVGSNS